MRGENTKEIQITLQTKSRKVGKTDKDKKGRKKRRQMARKRAREREVQSETGGKEFARHI